MLYWDAFLVLLRQTGVDAMVPISEIVCYANVYGIHDVKTLIDYVHCLHAEYISVFREKDSKKSR